MEVDEADSPSKARKIICTNVPLELLDKTLAKKHFRQFGRVLRIVIRQRSRSCIVEYDCTENAEMAILNAGEYMDKTFEVTWFDKLLIKRKRVKKDPDPDWGTDSDVQEELAAMAATGNGFGKSYNLRAEGMIVDKTSKKTPKIKKLLKRNWKLTNPKRLTSKLSEANTNIWTPEQLELLNILKQPAFTAEEKYKILEARDKLIRLRTKKHTDLTKATHTVGTCPDMCPEKERLMRETQHQVALYEQDATGKGMNPVLAVKQYSRSSADQEVPLPHELRPVSILQLTMGYLMHCLMNLCDNSDANLAEWYHFLWDRTRSIRKDITQQELCCQGSVTLIEQCARFHIHCSARLVAEEPSVFDQKINTENLTKCLQTLKYMYHDLHVKGESCANEAEFRAYIILLNLNDGNFMWEVQQLKLEIQKSPEVKFALEVYSAINKNNFVKFFKLVKLTGYLNACILLRYFVQVRTRALSAIVKCYSPRQPFTQFPLSELKNLLEFEDLASTVDFIVSYGLYLNPEETQLVLDRKSFQLPEIPYALDRAIEVVESKRKNSVGQTVCGGALPPRDFENYVPFNSFDENGLYRVTGALADMIKEGEHVMKSPDTSPIQDQTDSGKDVTKIPSLPLIPVTSSGSVFHKQANVTHSSSGSIFGTKIPALLEEKPFDPSQPFWSIKGEPKTTTGNIFKKRSESPSGLGIFGAAKPKVIEAFDEVQKPSIFGEQQKSSIFGDQQQKPNIFADQQQKSNIFADQQQKPSIFSEQPKPSSIFGEPKKLIFTEQQKPIIFTEQQKTAFGGPQLSTIFKEKSEKEPVDTSTIFGTGIKTTESVKTEKPLVIGDPRLAHGAFNIDKISSNVFGPKSQVPVQEVKSLPATTASIFNQVSSSQTLPSIKPFLPVARPPLKLHSDQNQEEKLKLEEQMKLRQLQKEQEEKLRRAIEDMKRKAELKKKQLEEEKQRKEKEILEKERQKRIEEERRIALLIERERKIALEIKQSVTTLMDDLLTKVEELHKKERLKQISRGIRKHKMLLFAQKWRRKIAISKRKRQAMDQNPIWLPSRTTDEEAKELFTDTQNLTLQNIKRYKYGKSFELPLPQKVQYERINVAHIYKILSNSYSKIYVRPQKEIFWKITVSLPDFKELKVGLNLIEDALTDFFQWKDRYGNTTVVDQYVADKHFGYCVEKKQGMHLIENNPNGLLFISHEPTELFFQRISKCLKNFSNLARVPIAVILVNNNTSNLNAQTLGKVLESDRHVTNYDILACKFTNAALVNAVKQSLDFLARFIEKPPPLELDMLQSFLQVHLAMELWKRISTYAAWNSKYKSCLKSPTLMINLYNEAVEKLKTIVLEKACLEYADFPDEFEKLLMDPTPDIFPCDYRYFPQFWRTEPYRCLLMNTMNSLKLPKYKGMWPPENETDLEQDIFNYCSEVFKESESVFYKLMAVILRKVDPVENFDRIKHVLWINIIEVIAIEKLRETNFLLNHTEFHSKSVFQQLFVVYDVKSLNTYCTDEWFYLKNPLVEGEIGYNLQNKKVNKKEVTQLELEDIDLDELEKSFRVDANHQIRRKNSQVEELQSFMDDLEESMEITKKINDSLQRTVKMALDVNK